MKHLHLCFVQVLIFSQMTSILDVLMDYCYLRGYEYSRLDGSMSYADRDENVSSVLRYSYSSLIDQFGYKCALDTDEEVFQ